MAYQQRTEVGHRLLHDALDSIATSTPDRAYCELPHIDWQDDGWYSITWSQFAKAIHRLAGWLDENLPQDQIITYSGPNDLTYAMVMFACSKSGRLVLIPDPLIPPKGLLRLYEDNKCTTFLLEESCKNDFVDLHALDESINFHLVHGYRYWLDRSQNDGPVQSRSLSETKARYEDSKWKNVFAVHTSGTTGFPKSVINNHAAIAGFDHSCNIGPPSLLYSAVERRLLGLAPFAWMGGIYTSICRPVFVEECGSFIVAPHDLKRPYLAGDIIKIIRKTRPEAVLCAPYLLSAFVKDTEMLDILKETVTNVRYAGAPLERWVGEALIENGIIPTASYGSVEMGHISTLDGGYKGGKYSNDHFKYFKFAPQTGYRMEKVEDDERSSVTGQQAANFDVYELVISKLPAPQNEFQCAFFVNPSLEEYRTNDLFRPFTENNRPDEWISVGRKDDFMKLNWLQKFHADDLESRIKRVNGVRNAIVGGQGRERECSLIELEVGHTEQTIYENLWNEIQELNEDLIDSLKINKELLIVAEPARPFLMTPKGSLKRQATLQSYQDEIEAAYTNAGFT